ncbi:MAG: sulfatase-like hydrolase/transferase [Bacteroidales bacterium]|nr:sulfatase-like hydrolase/transferase [Bacteroidales bacterium]
MLVKIQNFIPGCLLLIFFMNLTAMLQAQKPNILFIFSDDHRYDLLGVVNPDIYTPEMDLLVKSGIYFRNAFVTTAICSPSRASTMTGHYGSTNGVTSLSQHIHEGEKSFAHYLCEVGYRTSLIGKWHVNNTPEDMGFQQWAYFKSNGSWFNRKIHSNIPGVSDIVNTFVEKYNADRAIDYIADHVANYKGKPFVMWLCNQVPHVDGGLKYRPSKKSLARYDASDMPVPGNWSDGLSDKPTYLQTSVSLTKSAKQNYGGTGGYTNMEPGVRNEYLGQDNVQNHNREYYASITDWDREMGRVIKRLEDPDGDGDISDSIMGNTWIIFMGDNGWFTGHHKFTSKVLAYEESMRVPMFVRPPLNVDGSSGIHPRFEDNLVINIDLTQLILAIAYISIPDNLHGMNLKKLIEDENTDWRDCVYYEAPEKELGGNIHDSIRTGNYKYIVTYSDKIGGQVEFEELYDLQTDSLEIKNIVDEPAYKQVKYDMQQKLKAERGRIRTRE